MRLSAATMKVSFVFDPTPYVVNHPHLPVIIVYYCYCCSIYYSSLFNFCLLSIQLFRSIQLLLLIFTSKIFNSDPG
jgi:hypothetical protein